MTLKNLPRDEIINYKVFLDGKEASAARSGTASPPAITFRFAVFGDTRTNHQVHRAVIEARGEGERSTSSSTPATWSSAAAIADQWMTYFQIERPLMMKAPIIPSIGNHDLGNRGYYTRFFFLDKWTTARTTSSPTGATSG